MKCINCNVDMILDDEDYNFKGNFDQYLYCPKCEMCGFRKVRYNKCILEEQTKGEKVLYRNNPSLLDGGEFDE